VLGLTVSRAAACRASRSSSSDPSQSAEDVGTHVPAFTLRHPIPTRRTSQSSTESSGFGLCGATLGQLPSSLVFLDVGVDLGSAEEGSRAVLVSGKAPLRKQVVYSLPLAA
jgi:hypothetical protein